MASGKRYLKIPLYDHTSDEEVYECVETLNAAGFDDVTVESGIPGEVTLPEGAGSHRVVFCADGKQVADATLARSARGALEFTAGPLGWGDDVGEGWELKSGVPGGAA